MISNYLVVRTYFTYLVEGNQKLKNRGLVLNLPVTANRFRVYSGLTDSDGSL